MDRVKLLHVLLVLSTFTLSFKVTLNKMNRAELANFYALYGQGQTVLYASWMVEYICWYSNLTGTNNRSKGSRGNFNCREC